MGGGVQAPVLLSQERVHARVDVPTEAQCVLVRFFGLNCKIQILSAPHIAWSIFQNERLNTFMTASSACAGGHPVAGYLAATRDVAG